MANIEAVRLIALLAIVVGHVYTEARWSDVAIQSWRLPVFFLLSGFFWSSARPLAVEMRRRARSLLLPYAVWLVVLLVLVVAARLASGHRELVVPSIEAALLGGSYAQRPFTTFWFFTALFAAVVLYRLLDRAPVAVRLAVVAGGLAANLWNGPLLARGPWAIGTALGALAFLEIGRGVRVVTRKWSFGRQTMIGFLALGGGVLLAARRSFEPLDMKSGVFSPVAVLVALALGSALLIAAVRAPALPRRVASAVSAMTMPSLVVIVLHPAVLFILPPETTKVPLPLVAALAFVGPLVVGLVLVRTRWAQPLAGVETTRRVPLPRPSVVTAPV